jgi:hypothetical protein
MSPLNPTTAAELLATQGVQPASEMKKILSGFDASKPMYKHDFWPEDTLYQFIRLASVGNPILTRGSWFGIAGITSRGVGIFAGLAGRTLYKFRVLHPFSALEGTAATLPIDWQNEIGGPGGSTQVFVPRMYASHIRSLGPAEGW